MVIATGDWVMTPVGGAPAAESKRRVAVGVLLLAEVAVSIFTAGAAVAAEDWRVDVWGRDEGDVSFSGRKTIYFWVSQMLNKSCGGERMGVGERKKLPTCGEECGVGVDELSGEWSTSIGSPCVWWLAVGSQAAPSWTLSRSNCCCDWGWPVAARWVLDAVCVSTGERDTDPIDADELLDALREPDRSYWDEPCPRDVDRPRSWLSLVLVVPGGGEPIGKPACS